MSRECVRAGIFYSQKHTLSSLSELRPVMAWQIHYAQVGGITGHIMQVQRFTRFASYRALGNSPCLSCLQQHMRLSGIRSLSCFGIRIKFAHWFLCSLCSHTRLDVSCVTHPHLTSVVTFLTIQLSIVWVMRGGCSVF